MEEPSEDKILSIFNNCFNTFLKNPIFKIRNIIHNPDLIVKYIKDVIPDIETTTNEIFNLKLANDFDSAYNNLISILLILDKYLETHSEKQYFLPKLNINFLKPREILKNYNNEEDNNKNLLTNQEKCSDEEINFCEFLIILSYLSDFYKNTILEYAEKLDEGVVNYFLGIVDTFLKYDTMEEIVEEDENNTIGHYNEENNNNNNKSCKNISNPNTDRSNNKQTSKNSSVMLNFGENYKLSYYNNNVSRDSIKKKSTMSKISLLNMKKEKLKASTKTMSKLKAEDLVFSKRSSLNFNSQKSDDENIKNKKEKTQSSHMLNNNFSVRNLKFDNEKNQDKVISKLHSDNNSETSFDLNNNPFLTIKHKQKENELVHLNNQLDNNDSISIIDNTKNKMDDYENEKDKQETSTNMFFPEDPCDTQRSKHQRNIAFKLTNKENTNRMNDSSLTLHNKTKSSVKMDRLRILSKKSSIKSSNLMNNYNYNQSYNNNSNFKESFKQNIPYLESQQNIYDLANTLQSNQVKQEAFLKEQEDYNEQLNTEIERLNAVIQELYSKIYVHEINEHNNKLLEEGFTEVALENDELKKQLQEKDHKVSELELALNQIRKSYKEEAKSLTLKVHQLEEIIEENNDLKETNKKLTQSLLEYSVYKQHSEELKIIKSWNENLYSELEQKTKENKALLSKLEKSNVEATNANKAALNYKKSVMELEVEMKKTLDEAEKNERLFNYRLYSNKNNNNEISRIHSKSVLNINDYRNRITAQTKNKNRLEKEYYLNENSAEKNSSIRKRGGKRNTTVSPLKRFNGGNNADRNQTKQTLYMNSSFRNKDLLLCYNNYGRKNSIRKSFSPKKRGTFKRHTVTNSLNSLNSINLKKLKTIKSTSYKEGESSANFRRKYVKFKSFSHNFNENNSKIKKNLSAFNSPNESFNAVSNSKRSLLAKQSFKYGRNVRKKISSGSVTPYSFNILRDDSNPSPVKRRNFDDDSIIKSNIIFPQDCISEESNNDSNGNLNNNQLNLFLNKNDNERVLNLHQMNTNDDISNEDDEFDDEEEYDKFGYIEEDEEECSGNTKNKKSNKSIIYLQDLDLLKEEEDKNVVTSIAFNSENMTSDENQKAFKELLQKGKGSSKKNHSVFISNKDLEKIDVIEEDTKGNNYMNKDVKLGENIIDTITCETRFTPQDLKLYESLKRSLEEMKKRIDNLEIEKYKLARENELVRRDLTKHLDTIKISNEEKDSYKVLLDNMQSNIHELVEQKAKSHSLMLVGFNGEMKSKSFLGSSSNLNANQNYNTFNFNTNTNYSTNINNNRFNLDKQIISKQIVFSYNSFLVSANDNIFFKFNNILKDLVNDDIPVKFKHTDESKLTMNDLNNEEGVKIVLEINRNLVKLNKGQGEEIDNKVKLIQKLTRDFQLEKDSLLMMLYKLSMDFQQLKILYLKHAQEIDDHLYDEDNVTELVTEENDRTSKSNTINNVIKKTNFNNTNTLQSYSGDNVSSNININNNNNDIEKNKKETIINIKSSVFKNNNNNNLNNIIPVKLPGIYTSDTNNNLLRKESKNSELTNKTNNSKKMSEILREKALKAGLKISIK